MFPLSKNYSTSYGFGYDKPASASVNLKDAVSSDQTKADVAKKSQPSTPDAPTPPAVVLNISSTSVLLSSNGSLYRSNANWSKVL